MSCLRKCYPFCPDPRLTGKKAEVKEIIRAGTMAVYDVLTREKNLSKPPFSDDLDHLFYDAFHELAFELAVELEKDVLDYDLIRAEAGDAMAYLMKISAECDKKIASGCN